MVEMSHWGSVVPGLTWKKNNEVEKVKNVRHAQIYERMV